MKIFNYLIVISIIVGCNCIKNPTNFRKKYDISTQKISDYCGKIDKYDQVGHTLLMEAVIYGKNFSFIEGCLKNGANIFLKEEKAIVVALNSFHYLSLII